MAISRPQRQLHVHRAASDRWITVPKLDLDLHAEPDDVCDVGRLGRTIIVGSVLGSAAWIGLIVIVLRVVRALI